MTELESVNHDDSATRIEREGEPIETEDKFQEPEPEDDDLSPDDRSIGHVDNDVYPS